MYAVSNAHHVRTLMAFSLARRGTGLRAAKEGVVS